MSKKKFTAGELAKKASLDTTNYNILELGHAVADTIPNSLRECIEIYKNIIDEEEFCIVRQLARYPLIKEGLDYKYFGYPFLPKPRPEQVVFLYNRAKDDITKRLWTLPSPARMAQLATTTSAVPKLYEEMQAWSIAFFKGTFWDFVRHYSDINTPSEHEYFLEHREELIKAGCKIPDANSTEPFDFSKIHIKNVVDTQEAIV